MGRQYDREGCVARRQDAREEIWKCRNLRVTILGDHAPGSVMRLAANWNRFSSCWGHGSVQTTERYLGSKQRYREAVNDRVGIEPTE